jgi:uncharacterized tellurite resistance protein B-like protein
MLDRIIDTLKKKSAPKPAAPITPEVKRLAAAALMVEAARRDQDFAADERAAIVRIVGENFKLTGEDASTLVSLAEQRQRLPYGESIFTRTISESFTPDERKDVVRMLWEVALSDGQLHRVEAAMIERLTKEIGLDVTASDAARKAAEARA